MNGYTYSVTMVMLQSSWPKLNKIKLYMVKNAIDDNGVWNGLLSAEK